MHLMTAEYEQFVESAWLGPAPSPKSLRDYFIAATGLAGETGEVIELLKKHVRDGQLDVESLKFELGDVLYYLTVIARANNLSLPQIMYANAEKVRKRLSTDKAKCGRGFRG